MVTPGHEYCPAHSNGQTTRKALGDHVLLSPVPIRGGIERKGVINPSRDGDEAASSVLSPTGVGTALRCHAQRG